MTIPTDQEVQHLFCAELAREEAGPIFGTATDAKVWLLLEYREPWHTKAVNDNDLPPAVLEHLNQHLAAIPHSRLLFIKQQKPAADTRRFFVVNADETEPAVYAFDLDAYTDLLELDVTAVAQGVEDFRDQRHEAPLLLVCANTKRDKCCAKFGIPAHKALADHAPELTWQSTHIGGHRYAPNILFLPHSVNYGHLAPELVSPAVDAYLAGRLFDLDYYRGRTHYAPEVQAADYFLRRELGLLDVTGLRLRSAEAVTEDTWHVQFDLANGETHEIVLQSGPGEQRLVSCSPPVEDVVPRYFLVAHKRVIDG